MSLSIVWCQDCYLSTLYSIAATSLHAAMMELFKGMQSATEFLLVQTVF